MMLGTLVGIFHHFQETLGMSVPNYSTLISLLLLHSIITVVTGQQSMAVVGFDQTAYAAVEESRDEPTAVEVCVSLLSGQLVETFVVSVTTQSGTAMGKC